MARPKGHPKTGGRKPGTLNRRSEAAIQKLEDHDLDPLDELIASAREYMANGEREKADKILLEIMPYAFPKLKSQEVEVSVGNDELADRLQRARAQAALHDQREAQSAGAAPKIEHKRSEDATTTPDRGNEPRTEQEQPPEPVPAPARVLPGQAPSPADRDLPDTADDSPDWDYSPTSRDD